MAFKVKVYKNSSFRDKRGYYWTSWKKGLIKNLEFKHDKFSLSKKNVLRGLHGDKKTWKLISCPYGKFFLVALIISSLDKPNLFNKYSLPPFSKT